MIDDKAANLGNVPNSAPDHRQATDEQRWADHIGLEAKFGLQRQQAILAAESLGYRWNGFGLVQK